MSNARELAELGGSYGQGGFVGMKNRIINGAMMIDQRNAGASVSTSSGTTVYTVDRWAAFYSSTNKYTVQQTPSATETGYATRVAAGFANYLAVTSSAATSLGASDYYLLSHRIEGFNTADMAWGTSNAKPVTLSFWVRSSLTGTFGGSFASNGDARTNAFSYTISSANTWEYKTVTIAGDTSGTWNTTNSTGIGIYFGLGVGSSLSTTTGTWGSTPYYSATGATSVVGTNGATFYITGVQLEKGSTATSFDYRPYGTELALCQRYFYKVTGYSIGFSLNGTFGYNATVTFPVTMRTAPTLASGASYSVGGGSAGTPALYSSTGTGTTAYTVMMYNTANNWTANQNVSVTGGFNSEL